MSKANLPDVSKLNLSVFKQIILAGCLATLVACGAGIGGSGSGGSSAGVGSSPPPRVKRNLGVQLTGLTQPGLVLQTSSGDELAVAENGTHYFGSEVSPNDNYAITVKEQPAGEVCTVKDGSGLAVADVMAPVICSSSADSYDIGGHVTGLSAGNQITIQNNGGDPLSINAEGKFTFSKPVASGGSYAVTVAMQPAGQICTVAYGAGNDVHADVNNVEVSCVSARETYVVGGTVAGLNQGNPLVLYNNGNNNDVLLIAANGSFNFPIPVAAGSSYNVIIGVQPVGQQCAVSNGSGMSKDGDNISNVTVNCVNN